VLVPVAAAACAILVAALASLAAAPPDATTLVGLVALLAAAFLAEWFPFPIESLPAGQASLATVFLVGAAVLFGWAEATVLAVVLRLSVEALKHRPLERLIHNASSYALAAAAAGGVAALFDTDSTTGLVVAVVAGGATYYAVNVALLALAVARFSGEPILSVARTAFRWALLPYGLMVSGTLMLVVLWDRSPVLSLALVGPVLAIALYQRSVHNTLVATRLALTDALTGLGNQRHFGDRLQQELDAAASSARPLALCLLDVDHLKHVNDTLGHPSGDELLAQVAACLRHGGEAYRVGGDEFALLLPGRDAAAALDAATSVLERIRAIERPEGTVAISGGLAVFPEHVRDRSDLYRAADQALYDSKRSGGAQIRVYAPQGDPPLDAVA